MKQHRSLTTILTITVTAAWLLTSAAGALASRPRLNLFPTDVKEQLSNTGAVAGVMERNLRSTIEKLETQTRLYPETGCEGSSDPGCLEISRQMGDQYMEMLSIMKANLPEMRSSIAATNRGIEKNLRRELGKKTAPADIQRFLGKQEKPKVFKGRYSLSSRFSQYSQLIRTGNTSNLASLAAEIYLDSREVLTMIDIMEAEIAQQETIHQLGQMYGTLTPEMITTVDAVKAVIFGDIDDGSVLPEAHSANAESYRSPLELF